jgi:hypothetical protein
MSESVAIEERLRRFTASPDDRDWSDVLRRAGAVPKGRTGSTSAPRRNVRLVLTLVGIVIVAAVVAVAALKVDRGTQPVGSGTQPVSKVGGHHSHALTGATIQLAGYRFRTPAGFKRSSTCDTSPSDSGPPPIPRIATAASAEGGCVDGGIAILVGTGGPGAILAHIPSYAEPVAVGSYHGYFLSHAPPDGCAVPAGTTTPCHVPVKMALYVNIPGAAGPRHLKYVVLYAQGLTEDQLIAVAQSGLPASPPPTRQTCTQNCG